MRRTVRILAKATFLLWTLIVVAAWLESYRVLYGWSSHWRVPVGAHWSAGEVEVFSTRGVIVVLADDDRALDLHTPTGVKLSPMRWSAEVATRPPPWPGVVLKNSWCGLAFNVWRERPYEWALNTSVPYWFLLVVWPILAIPFVLRRHVRRQREQRGLCPRCAYDLRASPTRCPECGWTSAAQIAPSPHMIAGGSE